MPRSSNVAIVMQDDSGLFIRHGTSKFRPGAALKGVRKGQTVRAWPWSGGLKVEVTAGSHSIWGKDA